ncbi:MAG: hypothetical protein R2932_02180 [Caldilineaceae bacterium]
MLAPVRLALAETERGQPGASPMQKRRVRTGDSDLRTVGVAQEIEYAEALRTEMALREVA